MYTLGLDIGTTTISAVITNEQHCVVDSLTLQHNAFLKTPNFWERIQDAGLLLHEALEIVGQLSGKYPIRCIGITGQQHGIVYLDKSGNLLSPLYTWQDQRGSQLFGDIDYTRYLSQCSGYPLANGYGLVSHFYNIKNGLVPKNAACICTIHDYIAMVLAGRTQPVLDPSDAHSLGFYNVESGCFDKVALEACGIDPGILPSVRERCILGNTATGIPVAIAIGDNPASFLGATEGQKECLLLNIGTGSQISFWTSKQMKASLLESRPYPLGGYLMVGAALCGGKAWALTERFFSDAVFSLVGQRISAYEGLEKMVCDLDDDLTVPIVTTTFDGTRQDPDKRASIENLSAENFSPGHIALGVLHGIVNELYHQYQTCSKKELPSSSFLIGSGNCLRRNARLQQIAANTFKMPFSLSRSIEEAAAGAAFFAQIVNSTEKQ